VQNVFPNFCEKILAWSKVTALFDVTDFRKSGNFRPLIFEYLILPEIAEI
jgi:hypothetical protein